MILPPSPVPEMKLRSTPFSSANFLASGEARIRPFDVFDTATGAAFGAEVTAAGAFSSTFFAGSASAVFSSFFSSAGAAVVPAEASNAEISSPFSPMIANNEFTGAGFPFSIPICNKTPSKNDSNSRVALSVSISASNSPDFTVSPTFLCHSATTPSVMVSLNLGMLMISAIYDLL
ncbi:hypothetical protein D3C80_1019220 [compost metagenome]